MMASSTPKMRTGRGEEVDLRPSTALTPKTVAIGATAVVFLLWLTGVFSFTGGSSWSSASVDVPVYSIMIDAGSTGSRIHAYHFRRSSDGLVLQKELFKQLKPGLSSFKADPPGGAKSLLPLLSSAKEYVPDSLHPVTPILLKATAGLRMLGEQEAAAILSEARSLLGRSGFRFNDQTGVEIMDGLSEAMFAWVTINYLRGSLAGGWRSTAVMLDLGGGSTQVAMSIEVGKGSVARTPTDVRDLNLMGGTHRLYMHSFLGYGLMAGRAGIFAVGNKLNGEDGAESCIPHGATVEFSYLDKKWTVTGKGTGSAKECAALVESHLKEGEFGPDIPTPVDGQPVFAMSYYFDRAVDAGLIEPSAQEAELLVRQFGEAAQRACSASNADIPTLFPNVKEFNAPYMCMDLSFIHQLLTTGFGLRPTTPLHLAKSMQFNGERVETQWTLGAALHEIL